MTFSITGQFHLSAINLTVVETVNCEEFISMLIEEGETKKCPSEIFSTEFRIPNKTIKFFYMCYDFSKTITVEKEKLTLGDLMYLYPKTLAKAFENDETEEEPDFTYSGRFEITYSEDMCIVNFALET